MGVSKYDNNFKLETIEKGHLRDFIETKKRLYYESSFRVLDNDLGVLTWYHDNQWTDYVMENMKDPYFDCANRLIISRKSKVSRASKKIRSIIEKHKTPIFITLTFTDSVLESTSSDTRRRYVSRYLKKFCNSYVANVDYSPDLGREHYHAVIGERCDFSQWLYGFVFAEQIRVHDKNVRRISNYINKLTNHAFKVETCKRLIYSRDLVQ